MFKQGSVLLDVCDSTRLGVDPNICIIKLNSNSFRLVTYDIQFSNGKTIFQISNASVRESAR